MTIFKYEQWHGKLLLACVCNQLLAANVYKSSDLYYCCILGNNVFGRYFCLGILWYLFKDQLVIHWDTASSTALMCFKKTLAQGFHDVLFFSPSIFCPNLYRVYSHSRLPPHGGEREHQWQTDEGHLRCCERGCCGRLSSALAGPVPLGAGPVTWAGWAARAAGVPWRLAVRRRVGAIAWPIIAVPFTSIPSPWATTLLPLSCRDRKQVEITHGLNWDVWWGGASNGGQADNPLWVSARVQDQTQLNLVICARLALAKLNWGWIADMSRISAL